MHEPMNIVALAPFDEAEIVARLAELVAQGGVDAIARAFDELAQTGLDPADDIIQPLLIEAIFQLLETLEADPASAQAVATVLALDPAVAQVAADLLFVANFPDGVGDYADLGDGTLLLIAALKVAAGVRIEAIGIVERALLWRPALRFKRAAIQLLFLAQRDSEAVIQLLFEQMLDGLDHPEIWSCLPLVVAHFPDLTDRLGAMLDAELKVYTELWGVFHALCVAAGGEFDRGLALLEPIATAHSQSTMVQGAMFHIRSLIDPANPVYDLSSRFCSEPFEVFDILDGKSHLCCASWLPASVGDLAEQSIDDVWNSDSAQSIRASILDGSYRFCNKTACPKIATATLPRRDEMAKTDRWRDVINSFRTELQTRPRRLNLAYDQSCNLSCPSCRTGMVVADSATRARFDRLQEEKVLPLLRDAKLVFVTGSGDPFASKNFRNLLDRLGPEDYPDLRFQVMTNGMLFTPREWDRFPALHGRVAFLRISLDAATGPTHELLRRGARWPVMERNLAFAAELRAKGLIDRLDFSFTVQVDNYREMGAAIDLGHRYGADHVGFLRITNWGTFSADAYAERAVFMPSHPRHADFIDHMQDHRLRDPIAGLNDLGQFVRTSGRNYDPAIA